MKKLFLILFVLLPTIALAELVPVCHTNGKYGYKVSVHSPNFVIMPKFECALEQVESYAFVRQKGLWGVIGSDGKYVVKPKYSSASGPYAGMTIVGYNGKYGCVRNAVEIVSIIYDAIVYRKDCHCFLVKLNDKYGLFDNQGKEILSVQYDGIEEGVYIETILAQTNGKWGLFDNQGKEILPMQYDGIVKGVYDGTFLVKSNGKWGLLDSQGKEILSAQYDSIEPFGSNGVILVKANGKCGLLNEDCQAITSVTYDKIVGLSGDDVIVLLSGSEWTFVNSDGDTVEILNNIIFYTTTDGRKVGDVSSEFTHEYSYGIGVLRATENIYELRAYAFSYSPNLKSIMLPNSVTSIGYEAFYNCKSLTSVSAKGVASIGYEAFRGCESLTDVSAKCITWIASDAFDGCSSLPVEDGIRYAGDVLVEVVDKTKSSYTIKENVVYICDAAFKGCDKMVQLTIPNSVTGIGASAFSGCVRLTNVEIGNSVVKIGKEAFADCWSLSSIAIPDSVTTLGECAFKNCYSMTNATIGRGVCSIESGAFSECKSLKRVDISDLFAWCNIKMGDYYANPLNWGAGLYVNAAEVTELVIPSSITSINGYLFAGCTSIEKVVIPDTVTYIGEQAFAACTSLKTVVLGKNVSNIGSFAFSDCMSLNSVYYNSTIPATLEYYVFPDNNLYGEKRGIYVPHRAVVVYKSVWCDFSNLIVGYDFEQ